MQAVIAKRLLYPSKIPGKLLPEASSLLLPVRTGCSVQVIDDSKKNVHNLLETLLINEAPILTTVTKWSKHYYNQSSELCQKYYRENVMVTLDRSLNICDYSVRKTDECVEWNTERQKRITGSTCFSLYRYYKSTNPNWERRFEFAFKAKDFPLYLTRAMSHGTSHQRAAQKKYKEKMTGCTVLDLGLVVHPKVPFLAFSPDGVMLDKTGKPQNLIEIKCPPDGRSFSSKDILRVLPFFDPSSSVRSGSKYYGQVQLGMFLLGLPYCDFIVYSSSETDYVSRRIEFDELFLQKMMGSLVKVYFKEMLPWLAKKNLDAGEVHQ